MESTQQHLDQIEKPRSFLGYRHIQFFLLFCGVVIAYGMRGNLAVGVLSITGRSKSSNPDIPTHPEWVDQENVMISSFFMGYICLQIGAGQLAERYGPKMFLFISISIASLFSILIPVLSESMGYSGIILCRVIQGLSQGFLFPSCNHLISRWTPLSERTKVATFLFCGGNLGSFISILVTGVMCKSWAGWPSAFYLYGGLGFGWALAWLVFGSDSPSSHKYISEAERNYIQSATFVSKEETIKTLKTPWLNIAKSFPVWAILLTHCGFNWGYWTLSSKIPGYLNDYFNDDSSFLSAVPYLVMWLLSLLASPVADSLISKKILSIQVTRKVFNSIGHFIPALFLLLLSFINVSETVAVIFLVIAVGSSAAAYCGFFVNHIDLSPNFAGTLMGITNGIAAIVSIVAPLAIDVIKKFGYDQTDKELWTIVFCLAAGIDIVVGIIYLIFGSGVIQSWNYSAEELRTEKDLNA